MLAEFAAEFLQPRRVQRREQFTQARQQAQRIAQRRQVARARAAQGDPRQDAFDVAEGAEGLAQSGVRAVFERRDRVVPRAQHAAVAQRPVQPAPQQAPAHRRHRGIEHPEQGRAGVAVHPGIEFEVAARGRVHRDRAIAGFHGDGRQVRQPLLLCLLDIAQQRAGGSDGQRLVVDAEAAQVVDAEELQQLATAAVGVEQPRGAAAHARASGDGFRPAFLIRHQDFRRLQPREFGVPFQHSGIRSLEFT